MNVHEIGVDGGIFPRRRNRHGRTIYLKIPNIPLNCLKHKQFLS
jgi:hypothetical protein